MTDRSSWGIVCSASLLIVLAGAQAVVASAQTGEPYVPAPHKFVAPKLPQPKQWHSPAVPRSMVGGLWMTDPNYRSALYLKNDVEVSPQ